MLINILLSGFYYLTQGLVLALVVFMCGRGLSKRLPAVTAYLFGLLLVDGVARGYVLYHYGATSVQYRYFYWLSDVALALGAFLLVCTFFQRTCANQAQMWSFLRLFLAFVFILVLGISLLSLSRNYNHIYTQFIIEFQQNLYFTCLVLNTLLYILMQQIESADDELSMLVCGLGLQFAGPAASFALTFLMHGERYANSLMVFVGPLCTLGMLSTWFYALVRPPKTARVPAKMEFVPVRAGHGQAA